MECRGLARFQFKELPLQHRPHADLLQAVHHAATRLVRSERDGQRSFSTYATHVTQIDRVGGDLKASFLRTDLKVSGVKGLLDVVNKYGLTQVTLEAVDSQRNLRIISESGEIRVEGPAEVLTKSPMYGFTQCRRLNTNLAREVLDDVNFSTGRPQLGWNGSPRGR